MVGNEILNTRDNGLLFSDGSRVIATHNTITATNNVTDASIWHGFCLNVQNTEFTTPETGQAVQALCNPAPCVPDLLDGLNMAAVAANAARLTAKVGNLYGP